MLCFLIAAAVALPVSTASPTDSIDARRIIDAYSAIVHIKAVPFPEHDSLLVLQIDSPPPGNLLSGFYREHGRWFNYLVTNGRGFRFAALDSTTPAGGNSAAARLEADFLPRLAADSQFNALVIPAIANYLHQNGLPVRLSLLIVTRRRVPVDTAVKVATRFFYPDILTPAGEIWTHVCTVINAVRELPRRDPALEALAFSAISKDIMLENSRIEPDFRPARRLINELDSPGATKEVRLSRAQGVMWATMARSALLRDLLMAEAAREREILPFELEGR